METNIVHTDEQVVARKAGGLNPAWVIPILILIGVAIYWFVLGNPSNFASDPRIDGQSTVAFVNNIERSELHPHGLGIIYMGGIIVPILISFMLIVLVFSIERAVMLNRAQGSGNLDKFVLTIRRLLNEGRIDEAIDECDRQKGSVGNVVKEGLVSYKALANDSSMDKEQKMAALNKAIEEATTLEMPMLEKNMMILSTLGTVATLVALLGTVLGMIAAFSALGSGGGSPDSAKLSIGISEALVNTALGISTSAVAIILYNYFTSKIDGMTFKIDEIAMSIQQSFAEHH